MFFQWTAISGGQFRLLKRKAPLPAGELSYQMHTFNIGSAPPYAAISYMCGPPPSDQPLIVNGRSLTVRKNCLEALQQVHQHDEYEYIWLDCLCIHQKDLDEKSRQVQRMGQIYKRASCVLACVGPDIPGLQDLREAISALKSISDFDDTTKLTYSPKYRPWLDSLQHETLKLLTEALNRLGALPYWKRLWIIQEINLGKRIFLYIGPWRLPWRGIVALFTATQIKADTERGTLAASFNSLLYPESAEPADLQGRLQFGGFTNLIDGEDDFKDRRYPLDEALETFKTAECTLPHDAIYGLRELIQWPKELGAIIPDYKITPFDLALQVMRYERVRECEIPGNEGGHDHFQFAIDAAESLRISTQRVELFNLIQDRQIEPNSSDESNELSDAVSHQQHFHSTAKRCRHHYTYHVGSNKLLKLGRNDSDYFTAALDQRDEGEAPSMLVKDVSKTVNSCKSTDSESSNLPQPLYNGKNIIGWLPRQAQAGDCLAMLYQDEAEPGLVLRPVDGTPILKLVGIFLLQQNVHVGGHSFVAKGQELILHLDHEDLLVFATAYCWTADKTEIRAEKLLERLCTRPTRSKFSSYGVLAGAQSQEGNTARWVEGRGWVWGPPRDECSAGKQS